MTGKTAIVGDGDSIMVFKAAGVATFPAENEKKAKEILLEDKIEILINANDGDGSATAWGCDLTYDYVKINGDYRT